MTNGRSTDQKRLFTLTWLPWLLGALVLVLYAATANRALPSLADWTGLLQQPPTATRYAGYTYAPEFLAPVYYIVTYPLRWLPVQHIPLALNFFSVLCGVLALTQLARSVALLPHDRTRDQRERETTRHSYLTIPLAWLPPVFGRLAVPLAAPTIDLTIHFRDPAAALAVPPDEPILGVFRSDYAADGLAESDGELWSPDGVLLAHSRQLMLLLPLDPS